jgi:hypothetical protein
MERFVGGMASLFICYLMEDEHKGYCWIEYAMESGVKLREGQSRCSLEKYGEKILSSSSSTPSDNQLLHH